MNTSSTRYFQACANNDMEYVEANAKKMIGKRDKRQSDYGLKIYQGFTGLMYAIMHDAADVFGYLLPYEMWTTTDRVCYIKMNVINESIKLASQSSVLHLAIAFECYTMAHLIIEFCESAVLPGADVNVREKALRAHAHPFNILTHPNVEGVMAVDLLALNPSKMSRSLLLRLTERRPEDVEFNRTYAWKHGAQRDRVDSNPEIPVELSTGGDVAAPRSAALYQYDVSDSAFKHIDMQTPQGHKRVSISIEKNPSHVTIHRLSKTATQDERLEIIKLYNKNSVHSIYN